MLTLCLPIDHARIKLLSRYNRAGSSSEVLTGNGEALEFVLLCRGRSLTDSGPVLVGFTPFSRESLVEISDRDTVHGVKGVF